MRKFSHQREFILDALKSVKTHPTASEIFDTVKKKEPSISLATVYRNLNLLRDSGEIISFKTFDGSEHFDGDISDHRHFVCKHCGGISDIFIPGNAGMIADIENRLDCTVEFQQILYYGKCKICSNK